MDCTKYCIGKLQNNTDDILIYDINDENKDLSEKDKKEILENIAENEEDLENNDIDYTLSEVVKELLREEGLPFKSTFKKTKKVIALIRVDQGLEDQITIRNEEWIWNKKKT